MKKVIGILFGGVSSEYSVSLHSCASFVHNFPRKDFDYALIGIAPNGRWYHFQGSIEAIEKDSWQTDLKCREILLSFDPQKKGFYYLDTYKNEFLSIDCIFPVIHGPYGEDGKLQGLLSCASMPFVGCNTLSSAICMDKEMTHRLMQSADIKMAKWMKIDKRQSNIEEDLFINIQTQFKYPLIVKPCNEGSSLRNI